MSAPSTRRQAKPRPQLRMSARRRRAIFEALRAANPAPRTELEYASAFELLVAVVLSAQATDKSVNLATRKLFPVANTPEAILALGVAGLTPYIRTIGLFNSKAKHLIETCRALVEQHGGVVPRTREALEALPGVGRKTANVILNTAFGTAGSAGAPFNLGRTATHEIGHFLNLRHIWGDTPDCSGGDFVDDTPNAETPNYGKPAFPRVSCSNGPNGDMFMNYMDYTDDDSMYMFTPGQVARMHTTLDGPRKSLVS